MSTGDFLESLSQAMLVGTMLVGRLGVLCHDMFIVCYAMLCYAMLCYAMLCYAML